MIGGVSIMEVEIGNPCPTSRARWNLAVGLSDPERMMHKAMTWSQSYKDAKQHESDGIDIETAAAFHNKMLAVTVIQNALKIQALSTDLVENEKSQWNPDQWLANCHETPVTMSSHCLQTSFSWWERKMPKLSSPILPRYRIRPRVKRLKLLKNRLKTLHSIGTRNGMKDWSWQCTVSLTTHWKK